MQKEGPSRHIFLVLNYTFFTLYALLALFPLLHLAAISLSKASYADAGLVVLIPKGFNTKAYEFIFSDTIFFTVFFNSIKRIATGVPLNLLMIVLAAYPLSRPKHELKNRSFFSWFFIITMLFSGGMVPMYMLVNALRLPNTMLALILPGAVPIFSVILMINFFKQVPGDFHEAAEIDGASEYRILFNIYIPLSMPSVITVTLFSIVSHWNSWFDGILYMDFIEKFPLQSYLQSVVIDTSSNIDNLIDRNYISQITVDNARLFLAVIPIALMYFPMQKYFVKGLTLGGIKG